MLTFSIFHINKIKKPTIHYDLHEIRTGNLLYYTSLFFMYVCMSGVYIVNFLYGATDLNPGS